MRTKLSEEPLILVVEDERYREHVRALRNSYPSTRVVARRSVDSAVQFLQDHEDVAVVVCDINLPTTDVEQAQRDTDVTGGWQVISELERMNSQAGIIVYSAFLAQNEIATAYCTMLCNRSRPDGTALVDKLVINETVLPAIVKVVGHLLHRWKNRIANGPRLKVRLQNEDGQGIWVNGAPRSIGKGGSKPIRVLTTLTEFFNYALTLKEIEEYADIPVAGDRQKPDVQRQICKVRALIDDEPLDPSIGRWRWISQLSNKGGRARYIFNVPAFGSPGGELWCDSVESQKLLIKAYDALRSSETVEFAMVVAKAWDLHPLRCAGVLQIIRDAIHHTLNVEPIDGFLDSKQRLYEGDWFVAAKANMLVWQESPFNRGWAPWTSGR